jgi:hypothetical protein
MNFEDIAGACRIFASPVQNRFEAMRRKSPLGADFPQQAAGFLIGQQPCLRKLWVTAPLQDGFPGFAFFLARFSKT